MGAWIGPYTLLFSKLVHQTGHVYAFDPDPCAFGILCDNLEANRITNVHSEKVCLSNSVGKAQLKSRHRMGKFGGSESTIIHPQQEKVSREITVETTTIDKYCEENDVHPDGIKIDVEGAEGLVIEGGRTTIRKQSPWVLLEFHGHLMSEEERQICWQKIVDCAKQVIFIQGGSNRYHYGSEVKSMPDCLKFHVFIQY